MNDNIIELLIIEEDEGQRLDAYISSKLNDISRSYIQKLIKDKKVTVNDKIEKAKYLTKKNDKIIVDLSFIISNTYSVSFSLIVVRVSKFRMSLIISFCSALRLSILA